MARKVLILSSSPRRGGNSDMLCDEFMRGAVDSNNEVEKVFLRDKTIHGIGADTQNTGDITYRIGSALLDTFHRTVLKV